jgi:hypothetical protein
MKSSCLPHQGLSSSGTNSKDHRRTTTRQTIRTPDATWLDLRKPERFKIFFQGLIENLKENLHLVKVEGSHEYYTCGKYHHWPNPNWKPFQNLWAYCEKSGHDFYEAKHVIEEQFGRRLMCECGVLNVEKAIRRQELRAMFGVDFSEAGKREVDVIWGVKE